jgi:hypothetical protein
MAMRPTINRHQIELDEYAFALLTYKAEKHCEGLSTLGNWYQSDV